MDIKEDNCPSWAHEQLVKLKSLEISLGHIPPHSAFNSQVVSEALDRLFADDYFDNMDEAATEILFAKIVKNLIKEGFTAENIVKIINARVGYPGGPPYCDVSHIEEALEGPR